MVCCIGRLTWSPATGRAPQDRATLTGSVITAAPSADADAYIPAMALSSTDILTQTPQGLYCPLGDFHIDPVRPVERALITHGHSDHARAGHGAVLATRETLRIMAVRYGEDFAGRDRRRRVLGEDAAHRRGRRCASCRPAMCSARRRS